MSFKLGMLILMVGLHFLPNIKSGFSANDYCKVEEVVWPKRANLTVLNSQKLNECPSAEDRQRGFNEIRAGARSLVNEFAETVQDSFSCGGTPGWRRVVFINMNDTSCRCPPGLSLTSFSKRTCGRNHTDSHNCSSTIFSVGGEEYSRVCGRIRGYQYGSNHAFYSFNEFGFTLEEAYMDGVSLTHGPVGSRQHIWTFASGLTESPGLHSQQIFACPCDDISHNSPPYISTDYFCESGENAPFDNVIRFFPDDPVWDGQGCSSTSTCCEFNNPPWFVRELPSSTTNDIELRLCLLHSPGPSDVPVDIIELTGFWYNEIGEQLYISIISPDTFTGNYTTLDQENFHRSGCYDSVGEMLGFVICWKNDKVNHHCTTSWCGQYHYNLTTKQPVIMTTWIQSKHTPMEQGWRSMNIVSDTLSRSKPSTRSVETTVNDRFQRNNPPSA